MACPVGGASRGVGLGGGGLGVAGWTRALGVMVGRNEAGRDRRKPLREPARAFKQVGGGTGMVGSRATTGLQFQQLQGNLVGSAHAGDI